MKHLEGKDVYLLPTGNNARGRKGNEFVKGHIIKVAKVFVTFTVGDSSHEWKYRMDDRNGKHLRNEYNFGYDVFENKQEIEDLKEIGRIADLIVAKFRYSSDYRRLDLATIRKVADLLEVE